MDWTRLVGIGLIAWAFWPSNTSSHQTISEEEENTLFDE
jgi:hypothetical protein